MATGNRALLLICSTYMTTCANQLGPLRPIIALPRKQLACQTIHFETMQAIHFDRVRPFHFEIEQTMRSDKVRLFHFAMMQAVRSDRVRPHHCEMMQVWFPDPIGALCTDSWRAERQTFAWACTEVFFFGILVVRPQL